MEGSAEVFVTIFKFCCITGASIMIGYWAYKYRINKDDTLLEYIPVEDIDDLIYPIPSICIPTPFVRNDSMEITLIINYHNQNDDHKKFLVLPILLQANPSISFYTFESLSDGGVFLGIMYTS